MTHINLTSSLWTKVNKNQFQSVKVTFVSEISLVTRNLIRQINKKTRSTKNEKWLHACTSVEIAWMNEQKADLKWLWRHMVVTKIIIKKKQKHSRKNSGSESKRQKLTKNRNCTWSSYFLYKTINSLTPRSDLKIDEI